jgi:hypothetical protein
MRSSLDTPNELGMADAEIDTLAAEAALSEVLDENARLKALLADYRRIQPDISLRAALSPGGGAEPTRVGVSGGVPSEAAPELERGGRPACLTGG